MKTVSIVLVGCGTPLRSMGWYHGTQIMDLRLPNAELKYVVEPWYLSQAGQSAPGFEAFCQLKASWEDKGVQFFESVSQLPELPQREHLFFIISARTSDNPKLFDECLQHKPKCLLLEKPGAPTLAELEAMKEKALAAKVRVFMGFNKNVSAYLKRALSFSQQAEQAVSITLVHNNTYLNTDEDHAECFERNSEGMLKNMLIHELAILATFYGVTTENIQTLTIDKDFTSCKTLIGPTSGNSFTDFDKLQFTIVTTDAQALTVRADRSGGDDSMSILYDAATQTELARYVMPDDEIQEHVADLEKKLPGAIAYFLSQDLDYLTIKSELVEYCLTQKEPTGVATLSVGCETLKLAEYLTPILKKQMES